MKILTLLWRFLISLVPVLIIVGLITGIDCAKTETANTLYTCTLAVVIIQLTRTEAR